MVLAQNNPFPQGTWLHRTKCTRPSGLVTVVYAQDDAERRSREEQDWPRRAAK